MAGFLYFFPESGDRPYKDGRVNAALLKRCGLTSVFSETLELPKQCTQHKCTGPNEIPGIVLCPSCVHAEEPPSRTFKAGASQFWCDRGDFWIGLHKGNEPKPEDLEREKVYPAFVLKDRYGSRWSLPIIRMPDGKGSLPVEYGFDRDGELIHRICSEFKDVWELSGDALDLMQSASSEVESETNKRWSEADKIKMSLEFLAINYRVSLHEVSALFEVGKAVFDTEFATSVLIAVTNWPVWVEYLASRDQDEKKKTSEPSLVAA